MITEGPSSEIYSSSELDSDSNALQTATAPFSSAATAALPGSDFVDLSHRQRVSEADRFLIQAHDNFVSGATGPKPWKEVVPLFNAKFGENIRSVKTSASRAHRVRDTFQEDNPNYPKLKTWDYKTGAVISGGATTATRAPRKADVSKSASTSKGPAKSATRPTSRTSTKIGKPPASVPNPTAADTSESLPSGSRVQNADAASEVPGARAKPSKAAVTAMKTPTAGSILSRSDSRGGVGCITEDLRNLNMAPARTMNEPSRPQPKPTGRTKPSSRLHGLVDSVFDSEDDATPGSIIGQKAMMRDLLNANPHDEGKHNEAASMLKYLKKLEATKQAQVDSLENVIRLARNGELRSRDGAMSAARALIMAFNDVTLEDIADERQHEE